MNQQNLPGTKHQSHAHRGATLEDLLSRTHEYYRARNLAQIEKQAVEWRYTGLSEYNNLAVKSGELCAKTNTGRYIKKVKSDVDFVGIIAGCGRFVCFDAKQTAEKSLPLSNVADHQIRTLLQKERCGAVSGLMILFSSLNRLFFVPAAVVDAAIIEMLYRKGRKSLSLADCIEKGREIEIKGNLADWLRVLL